MTCNLPVLYQLLCIVSKLANIIWSHRSPNSIQVVLSSKFTVSNMLATKVSGYEGGERIFMPLYQRYKKTPLTVSSLGTGMKLYEAKRWNILLKLKELVLICDII